MNWKKWLKYNPYKKLWSLVGGRPWTYISRDFYHKVEYVVIVGFTVLGYYLHTWVSHKDFWIGVGVLTVGFILGHFFWGRKWIPEQEGK